MSKVQKWCRSFSILGRHENRKLWPRSQPHESAYNNKCWPGEVSQTFFDQKSTFVINHFMRDSFTSVTTIINLNIFRHGVYVCSSQGLRSENLTLHVIDGNHFSSSCLENFSHDNIVCRWSHFDFYETLMADSLSARQHFHNPLQNYLIRAERFWIA